MRLNGCETRSDKMQRGDHFRVLAIVAASLYQLRILPLTTSPTQFVLFVEGESDSLHEGLTLRRTCSD